MYELIARLFSICRSITGDGVRQTHEILREYLPKLETHEVPSGTQCFDWVVPDEWNIRDAYIADQQGDKIVDFKDHNLHVVGYSSPVDREVSLEELQEHLFSLPEQPDLIPYVTSYYRPFWGFCLPDKQRKKLVNAPYHVFINSELAPGSLTYSDLYLPGQSKEEIFVSTYTCHPSMANNELSGPAVATFLAQWLSTRSNYYSYRFVFAPETIGPLVYLKEHLEYLRTHVIAAFNLTCVGDDRAVSFLPSRAGDTLADQVARHVLKYQATEYQEYDFFQDRGSDERQYCSPGVDLPMVSIMRSKYGTYPEYHTSADDLTVVSPEGLEKALELHKSCIRLIESNRTYQTQIIGEPQLSRRGIVVQFGGGNDPRAHIKRKQLQNFLTCCDGEHDLLNIAETIGAYGEDLVEIAQILTQHDIIKEI